MNLQQWLMAGQAPKLGARPANGSCDRGLNLTGIATPVRAGLAAIGDATSSSAGAISRKVVARPSWGIGRLPVVPMEARPPLSGAGFVEQHGDALGERYSWNVKQLNVPGISQSA